MTKNRDTIEMAGGGGGGGTYLDIWIHLRPGRGLIQPPGKRCPLEASEALSTVEAINLKNIVPDIFL